MTIANQIISFKLSGINYTGTSTQLNYTAGVTQGICIENKALVVNGSRNISGINALSATSLVASILTGTLQTASQPNITNLGVLTSLNVSGNLNIQGHNGNNAGLMLNGSIVSATSTELNYLSSSTPGTAVGNKALVVNNARAISNISALSSADITISNNFSYRGTIIASSGEMLNYVNTTPGTAEANRAVVLNSSRDITNINNISCTNLNATALSGTLSTSSQPLITSVGTLTSLNMTGAITNVTNISMNGNITGASSVSATSIAGTIITAAQPNITQIGTQLNLNVAGRTTTATATIGTLTLGSTVLQSSAEDLNKMLSITNGTASANRAVVLDSSRDITNVNSISCSSIISSTLAGLLTTPVQANITSVGVLTGLEVSSSPLFRILNNSSNQTAVTVWNNSITSPISARIEMDNQSVRFGTTTNHTMRFIANNQNIMSLDNTGNVSIGTITATSHRLNVEGSINATSLFIGNNQINATPAEINLLSSVTAGTVTAGRVVIVDNSRNITNFNNITCANLSATNLTGTITTPTQNNITSVGELTELRVNSNGVGGTFRNIISTESASIRLQNDIRNVEIGLRGSTSSISPNCLYIMESSNTRLVMESNGNFTLGGVGNSGNHRLNVIGGINSTSLFINNIQVNSTANELNYLAGLTLGVASSGRALTVDSNRDLSNIRNLAVTGTLTGTLVTASQPNITNIGTLTSLNMTGAISGVTNLGMTGNITGASIISANTLTGTISTASQPNITSVGTLSFMSCSGNIKIGTVSSPAADMLHVEGNNSDGLGIQIENRNTTSNSLSYIRFTGYNVNNDNYDLAGIACGYVPFNSNFGYGYLSFSTRNNSNSTTATERMRITQDGLIGVGRTNPVFSMDVNGAVNASEFRINGTLITSTVAEINRLSSVTAGTARESSVLVLDSNLSVSGINSLSATTITGSISTSAQPNITSVGTLQGLSVANAVAQFSAGVSMSGNLVGSSSNLSGFSSISATNITGTLLTSSQTNIQQVGVLNSLATSGAVKIGTQSNSALDMLHIELSTTGSAGIQLDNPNTTADSGTHIKFNGFNSTNQDYDLARISCGYVPVNSSHGFGYLSFATRNNASSSTATERMRITQNGLVGIGRTNPTYNFDMVGIARMDQLVMKDSNDTNAARAISYIDASQSVNTSRFICVGQANSNRNQAEISFRFIGAGNSQNCVDIGLHSSNKIHINANGFVGVNIPAPLNNIHINQDSTNTCLRLDRTGNSTTFVDVGCNPNGKMHVASAGMIIRNSAGGFTDPNHSFVFIDGTISANITSYGFINSSGTTGTNGSSGTVGHSLRTSGRIVSGAEINILSDKRLKKNINSLSDEYCKDFVYKIDSKSYVYKKDECGKINIGYVAQDLVRAGFEELIGFSFDNVEEVVDDDGFVNPAGQVFTVNYEGVVPVLSRNIKNLFEENKSLKKEIEDLKKILYDIQNKLNN